LGLRRVAIITVLSPQYAVAVTIGGLGAKVRIVVVAVVAHSDAIPVEVDDLWCAVVVVSGAVVVVTGAVVVVTGAVVVVTRAVVVITGAVVVVTGAVVVIASGVVVIASGVVVIASRVIVVHRARRIRVAAAQRPEQGDEK